MTWSRWVVGLDGQDDLFLAIGNQIIQLSISKKFSQGRRCGGSGGLPWESMISMYCNKRC